MSDKKIFKYFTTGEQILWISSVVLITLSFIIFDRGNYMVLVASLIGATSLIFCAKGNPFGQFLMIIFGILYGIISFSYAYYGEMITYIGMTVPMAFISLVSWIKNPFKENKSEVKIEKLKKYEPIFMAFLVCAVTVVLYFVLKIFNTANLIISTVSVSTSFLAAYLTFRRNPYYAFVYALNDIVLIVMWILATVDDISYLSVIICFIMFLFNDIYGFINWQRMREKQSLYTEY